MLSHCPADAPANMVVVRIPRLSVRRRQPHNVSSVFCTFRCLVRHVCQRCGPVSRKTVGTMVDQEENKVFESKVFNNDNYVIENFILKIRPKPKSRHAYCSCLIDNWNEKVDVIKMSRWFYYSRIKNIQNLIRPFFNHFFWMQQINLFRSCNHSSF